jgi:hypothetical protein
MNSKSKAIPLRIRGKRGPRPRSSATLKMVAREAGVSASTVSSIINRTVNVSDELRLAWKPPLKIQLPAERRRRGAWRWAGPRGWA